MTALQNYQEVEKDYRARYRQRVERQFKIGQFTSSLYEHIQLYLTTPTVQSNLTRLLTRLLLW